MLTETTRILAGNIRAEMARRGVSQEDIATRLGCTQQAVSRRVLGRVAIDVNELAIISEILSVSINDLLPRESTGSALADGSTVAKKASA